MSSFLHSSAWERFQQALGVETVRSGGQLYVKRQAPGVRYWLTSRCSLNGQLPDFLRGYWFARFEPIDQESLRVLQNWAKTGGYRLAPTISVQPRQSIIVDIKKKYEEVLQSMKQKQRYNIRLAAKNGVHVEIHSQELAAQLPRFWSLLTQTADRQQFRTHNQRYYLSMVKQLEKEKMAHFLFATKDGTDLATMLLLTYGKTATYLHGASGNHHRELMAPHLMHAEAIRFAQSLGCTAYDLWGTDLEYKEENKSWEPKTGHSSAGTSRFKLGFGGEVINYPGAFDLIFNPFCYTLYQGVRHLHSKKRSFQ
ncbi:peptidoglycan bridge formation glycyltransferase FemA/FemB family protein [Patescibacteria group bacterium]|nr:peptidoglycan bridge formation glycyltransferase FemA/FemB family protein [Patescibacteria group bacterium]